MSRRSSTGWLRSTASTSSTSLDEDEYFPPPRNLRDLQYAIESAATVVLGGSLLDRPSMDDRGLGASDVLAILATD